MPHQYRKLYEEGRRILEAVPIPDAALDARLLLEHVCGTDLKTLLVYPDREVEDEQAGAYYALIERRRLREPTAMILGEWDFMGLTFKVTKDTLIPEQDTEVLVETALTLAQFLPFQHGRDQSNSFRDDEDFRSDNPVTDSVTESGNSEIQKFTSEGIFAGNSAFSLRGLRHNEPISVLDLCTGSGCILLSLLHAWPEAVGIGTDISDAALQVAEGNAERLGLQERARFLQGDLWDALGETGIRPLLFDLIVSNPPYVPTAVIDTLEPEVRCGEPYAALNGGADGLDFYRRIIAGAGAYLKDGGMLLLESGFDEAADICALLRDAGFGDIQVTKDYGGLDRVVSARWT